MAEKLDLAIFEEAQEHAEDLKSQYSQRDTDFEAYEKMYLMKWDDKPTGTDIKLTMSPDARNAVLGSTRLMIATDPLFNVPRDRGKPPEKAEQIERVAKNIWTTAGRIAGIPVHYDAVLSGLLYGEMHIAITRTSDLVEFAKKTKKGAARAERIAALTPFLFEVWNPRGGYAEWDALGLCAYYRKATVRAGTLTTRFGDAAQAVISGKSRTDDVELSIFYDTENYSVWVDDTPIIAQEHGLPYIPISVTTIEGSRMFDKPEDQVQPLLYGMRKGELWERQNLSLTVLYTNLFRIGINPTYIHTAPATNPDKKLNFDASRPGGVIDLEPGETIQPLINKGIIDESFRMGLEIAEQKVGESTIYRQALGEPLAGSPAFSTVALLSQSGRLPLVSSQRRGGWGIADVMTIALLWMKADGSIPAEFELKTNDIPDNLQLDATLDVSLPQDKLQNANIANMLSSGEEPLTTKEWARENILSITNSAQMEKDIWSERAARAQYQLYLQQQIQRLMQQQQQPQTGGGMAQGMPPGQMPPEMMQPGAQMPPEMGMPPGGGQPMMGAEMNGQGFNPGMGGLPPQQGGMMPGPGMGSAPGEAGMMPPEGMV